MNKLDRGIDERLNDPSWETRMADRVIRSTRSRDMRRVLAIAASLLLATMIALGVYRKADSNQEVALEDDWSSMQAEEEYDTAMMAGPFSDTAREDDSR